MFNALVATTNKSRWTLDPRYLPGCVLWYDAQDSNTLSVVSGKVTFWKDKSVNQAHVWQDTVAQQPSYATNAMNTYPVVRFNRAVSTFLTGSSNSISLGITPYTIFAVEQNLSGGTVAGGEFFTLSGPVNLVFFAHSNANFFWYPYGTAVPWNSTTPRIHTLYGSNTSNGGAQQHPTGLAYMNGTRFGIGTTAGTGALNTQVLFGRQKPTWGNNFVSGDIAEIIMYNRELLPPERQAVEGYLKKKWGITLTLSQESRLFNTLPPYLRAFTPSNTLSATLWYDSYSTRNLSLSGGNLVTGWLDKAGIYSNTSSSLVQTVDSNCPVYQYDSVYGVSGIYFSNTASISQFLVPIVSNFYPVNGTYYSVVMAYRLTASSGPLQTVYTKISGTPAAYIERMIVTGGTVSATMNESTVSYTKTDLSMTVGVITAGTPNPAMIVGFENGNIMRYGTTRSVTSNHNFNFGIGGASNLSGMTGYIYEMLVFNYTLTTDERTSVQGYLLNKWNARTSLSSNNPYIGNPTTDLIRTPLTISYVFLNGNRNGDSWYNFNQITFMNISQNTISYIISPSPGTTTPIVWQRYSNAVFNPNSCNLVTDNNTISYDYITDNNTLTYGSWLGGGFSTMSYTIFNLSRNAAVPMRSTQFMMPNNCNLEYRMYNMDVTCYDTNNAIVDRYTVFRSYWTRSPSNGFATIIQRYG